MAGPTNLQGLNTYLALLQSGGMEQFPQQVQKQGAGIAPPPGMPQGIDIASAFKKGEDAALGISAPAGMPMQMQMQSMPQGFARGGRVRGYAEGGEVLGGLGTLDDIDPLIIEMARKQLAAEGDDDEDMGGISYAALLGGAPVTGDDTPTSEDKALALAQAGFGMAAGDSPHALQNIGAGALGGVQALQKAKQQRALLRMREAQAAQQAALRQAALMDAAKQKAAALAQKKAEAEAENERKREADAAQAAYRADQLALRGEIAAGNQANQAALAEAAAARAAAAAAAAPKGVTPPNPEMAKQAGVPFDVPNPYERISAKEQEEMYKTNQKLFETNAAKLAATEGNADQMMADLKRFKELNEETDTGPMLAIPGGQLLGKQFSANLQEMDSITSRLAPVFRNGLPGAASDADIRMFKNAGPEITKDKVVNDARADAMLEATQNAKDKGQFMRDFFAIHGHTQGADAKWKEYLEANPIFKHGKDIPAFTINDQRKSYREYFGGASTPAAAAPVPGGGDAEALYQQYLPKK